MDYLKNSIVTTLETKKAVSQFELSWWWECVFHNWMSFHNSSLFSPQSRQTWLERSPVTHLSGSSRRRAEKLTSTWNPEPCTHTPTNARTPWLTSRCTKTPKYWWQNSWSIRAAVYLLKSSRSSTTSSASSSRMRNTWRRPFLVPMS